jgi:hypothetical protein
MYMARSGFRVVRKESSEFDGTQAHFQNRCASRLNPNTGDPFGINFSPTVPRRETGCVERMRRFLNLCQRHILFDTGASRDYDS